MTDTTGTWDVAPQFNKELNSTKLSPAAQTSSPAAARRGNEADLILEAARHASAADSYVASANLVRRLGLPDDEERKRLEQQHQGGIKGFFSKFGFGSGGDSQSDQRKGGNREKENYGYGDWHKQNSANRDLVDHGSQKFRTRRDEDHDLRLEAEAHTAVNATADQKYQRQGQYYNSNQGLRSDDDDQQFYQQQHRNRPSSSSIDDRREFRDYFDEREERRENFAAGNTSAYDDHRQHEQRGTRESDFYRNNDDDQNSSTWDRRGNDYASSSQQGGQFSSQQNSNRQW